MLFIWPQRKKSRQKRSGECAGQFTGPPRPIYRPGYAVSTALRTSALKCAGALSCWNHKRAFMLTGTLCSRTLHPYIQLAPYSIFYNQTGDYYYPNMVKNGSSVDDLEEVQVTNGPIGFGRAVDFTANSNETSKFCLKIHVVPKNKADESCWDNPQNCDKGMSVSIWLKVTFYRNDVEKRFVFSTGADGEGTPGVALYFKGIYLYAVVSTGDDMWTLTVPGPVKNNTWNELGIRWSRDTGLDIDSRGFEVGRWNQLPILRNARRTVHLEVFTVAL
ncbi:uncharacterized protein TNCV_4294881 [Trichonephila clavipes]|uniref:Uncharacterized protein n=1 Tax=Trichonephila clavipes TaxID=2585209 RepID=A0A8X6RMY7_TRICX|nr:uncharacterized protein TNCV_4294881 [Trichonephila clavipes]